MYCEIVNTFSRFHHCFGNRRVRVHRATQFIGSRLELHRHTRFGNQLRRVWPDDVYAQDLVVLLLTDNLYKSFFFAEYARLA